MGEKFSNKIKFFPLIFLLLGRKLKINLKIFLFFWVFWITLFSSSPFTLFQFTFFLFLSPLKVSDFFHFENKIADWYMLIFLFLWWLMNDKLLILLLNFIKIKASLNNLIILEINFSFRSPAWTGWRERRGRWYRRDWWWGVQGWVITVPEPSSSIYRPVWFDLLHPYNHPVHPLHQHHHTLHQFSYHQQPWIHHIMPPPHHQIEYLKQSFF